MAQHWPFHLLSNRFVEIHEGIVITGVRVLSADIWLLIAGRDLNRQALPIGVDDLLGWRYAFSSRSGGCWCGVNVDRSAIFPGTSRVGFALESPQNVKVGGEYQRVAFPWLGRALGGVVVHEVHKRSGNRDHREVTRGSGGIEKTEVKEW